MTRGSTGWGAAALALAAALGLSGCAKRVTVVEPPPKAIDWPKVQEINRAIEVIYVVRSPDNGTELVIKSDKGAPLYTLKCHTLDHHDPQGLSLTYTGMMQCYMFPWQRTIGEPNLLDEANRSIGQESRGRFARGHVMPNCVRTPEWGGERVFFLRGMAITLSVTNRQYMAHRDNVEPVLESFTFRIGVQSQSKATSAQALPAPGQRPGWFDSGVCPSAETRRAPSRVVR